MRQTLFYIPHEIAGLTVFGFGWALILWAILSLGWLAYLTRKQGFGKETQSYVPILLVIGAAIAFVLPMLEQQLPTGEPLGLPIRGYGVMLLLAIVLGVSLAMYQAERVGLSSELILSLAFWMFLGGIFGARLFYVVEYWETFVRPTWTATLVEILKFTEGGLIVYGSAIGGLLAAAVFLHHHRLPVLAVGDIIAPGMLLGLAIGRIGCFLNGCCYGGLCTEEAISVTFPRYSNTVAQQLSPPYYHQLETGLLHGIHLQSVDGKVVIDRVLPGSRAEQAGVRPGLVVAELNGVSIDGNIPEIDSDEISPLDEAQYQLARSGPDLRLTTEEGQTYQWSIGKLPERSLPVHPTQLYSAMNAALVAFLLYAAFPFRRRDGQIFALMLTLYPMTRYVMEIIRTDESAILGTPWTLSQIISLGLIGSAVLLWIYIWRRPRLSFTSPPNEPAEHVPATQH